MALPSSSMLYRHLTKSYQGDFAALRAFVASCPEGGIVEFGAGAGRILQANLARDLTLVEPDAEFFTTLQSLRRPNVDLVNSTTMGSRLPDDAFAGVIFAFNSIAEMSP